jgi:hypothetical protein
VVVDAHRRTSGEALGRRVHQRHRDVFDVARYRWLRNGNAYFPEEAMIRGGQQLDDAIDAEIMSAQE